MVGSFKLHVLAFLLVLGGLCFPSDSLAHTRAQKPVAGRGAVENPSAIVYVSPWCGHVYRNPPGAEPYRNACQQVMHDLREAGVPFETRDVFDERWREEYVAKMESIGRRPPAVPLTDIEGVLVLGSHTSLHSVATALRKGEKPSVAEKPGYTHPPSPHKPVYKPGTTWVEPPESPAVVYRGKSCPHCPAAKTFLAKHGVESFERHTDDTDVRDELQAHMARFGRSGGTSPSIELHGRFMEGFDDQAIEAIVRWRATQPQGSAPSSPRAPDSKTPAARSPVPSTGPSIRVKAVRSKNGSTHLITVDARDPAGVKDVELVWYGQRARRLVCGEANASRPFQCSRRGNRAVFRIPTDADKHDFVARYTNGKGEKRHSAVHSVEGRVGQ